MDAPGWRSADVPCPPGARVDDRRCRSRRDDGQRRRGQTAREVWRSRDGAPQPGEFQAVSADTVNGPTPLLDVFKQGEAEPDVRLLAAQGVLAPRAHEQLAILVLLLEDSDPEISRAADATLDRIP